MAHHKKNNSHIQPQAGERGIPSALSYTSLEIELPFTPNRANRHNVDSTPLIASYQPRSRRFCTVVNVILPVGLDNYLGHGQRAVDRLD